MKKIHVLLVLGSITLITSCTTAPLDQEQVLTGYKTAVESHRVIAYLLSLLTAGLIILLVMAGSKAIYFLRKAIGFVIRSIKRKLLWIVLLGSCLFLVRNWWPDLAWEWYQRVSNRVVTTNSDVFSTFEVDRVVYSHDELVSLYQQQLRRNTDSYEYLRFEKLIRRLADTTKMSLLSYYEPLYFECGLNPFRVRDDEGAAGLIQFTKTGLNRLTYKGSSISLSQVIAGCQRRDIEMIESLTWQYMLRRYTEQGGFKQPIDVYLAIFAPAFVGSNDSQVLYAGKDDPKYYKNAGFDGWYKNSDGLILRNESRKDYKITVGEMKLALEAKRVRLVRYMEQKHSS